MYLDHYSNAPLLLRKRIEVLLAKLEVTITQESKVAFANIISKNPNLHIYSIGLFYTSEGWDSITPIFFSEEGLQHVAESYAFNCADKLAAKKTALRWSPCDSPHYDDDSFFNLMPITKILLKEMSKTLDIADPMFKQYQWPEGYLGNYNLFYEFLTHVYHKIQNAVISGLREVWKTPALRDFFIANRCALTLSSDPISNERLLGYAAKLNTEVTYNKLKQELEQAQSITSH